MDKEIFISKEGFNKKDHDRYIITADVGGTNTYVAVFAVNGEKEYYMIFKHIYLTKDIERFEEIINDALKEAKEEYDIDVNLGCIGAAGPVSRRRGYIKLTNVNLEINESYLLSKTLLNKIILINDFEAIGYGIDILDLRKDAVLIPHVGEDFTNGRNESNAFAVIGAGTGLGISIAPYDKNKHLHAPMPSEGGHIDFSAYNKEEMELSEFLKNKVLIRKEAHPEIERILSGEGIHNIFNFLCSKEDFKQSDILQKIKNLEGDEKLREIEICYDKDEICKKTMDMFLKFYARAARNLALMSECYSGLFITGRIALKNIDLFKKESFMKEFEMHDKRSDVLRKVPVYIITNRDVGLYGCCNVAINFFNV